MISSARRLSSKLICISAPGANSMERVLALWIPAVSSSSESGSCSSSSTSASSSSPPSSTLTIVFTHLSVRSQESGPNCPMSCPSTVQIRSSDTVAVMSAAPPWRLSEVVCSMRIAMSARVCARKLPILISPSLTWREASCDASYILTTPLASPHPTKRAVVSAHSCATPNMFEPLKTRILKRCWPRATFHACRHPSAPPLSTIGMTSCGSRGLPRGPGLPGEPGLAPLPPSVALKLSAHTACMP
mmetsp:Transcript_53489/g.122047  ORF Transcript_53489/g.122047 Transcript_53489/m.122047 type:complete len:245 (+) Transcript_53489:447-1181(+)